MKKFLVLAMALAVVACTEPDRTMEILQAQGFVEIEITGYKVFGCGEDDIYRTGFRATSANGEEVSGVACSGVFKGTTLRFQ